MELENIPENAEIYDETEEYIIIDNQQMMPMIVWKDKNVTRDLKVGRMMKKAIQMVGEKLENCSAVPGKLEPLVVPSKRASTVKVMATSNSTSR